MLDGGEDPLYLARRLVRMAIEDIGLADPQALVQALAAKDVFDFLGSPEGELALAQATIYLATAPKSNAAYMAYNAAMRAAKEHGSLMPPKTSSMRRRKLMKQEGYGAGYAYDHERRGGVLGPELLSRRDDGAAAVLRSARPRLRSRDQEAARSLGQAAPRAGRQALAQARKATDRLREAVIFAGQFPTSRDRALQLYWPRSVRGERRGSLDGQVRRSVARASDQRVRHHALHRAPRPDEPRG